MATRTEHNTRQREQAAPRLAFIQDALKDGQSQSDIARTLGVSRQRVHQLAKRMNRPQ